MRWSWRGLWGSLGGVWVTGGGVMGVFKGAGGHWGEWVSLGGGFWGSLEDVGVTGVYGVLWGLLEGVGVPLGGFLGGLLRGRGGHGGG